MKIAIIVVGYNRIEGLIRLLDSLTAAEYGGDRPTLILSIDKSGTDAVEKFANEYVWIHGEKIVRTFPENQGLKKHILSCGDFFSDFDELIILEDDIFVAPSFYLFAKQCGEFYQDEENVAGISLYQHLYSIDAARPFMPLQMGADVFFMKYAQSWGQVWLKEQWLAFKQWYDENSALFEDHPQLPENVCHWSKASWLKYHIRYCVKRNKYFVYPYASQVTCFADVGVHNREKLRKMQVPLQYGVKRTYELVRFDRNDPRFVSYDQYYENEALEWIDGYECDVDLYGRRKKHTGRYRLSMDILDKKIVRQWGLELRPMEANVLLNIPGNEIFLYDMEQSESNPFSGNVASLWQYDYRMEGMLKREIKAVAAQVLLKVKRR